MLVSGALYCNVCRTSLLTTLGGEQCTGAVIPHDLSSTDSLTDYSSMWICSS